MKNLMNILLTLILFAGILGCQQQTKDTQEALTTPVKQQTQDSKPACPLEEKVKCTPEQKAKCTPEKKAECEAKVKAQQQDQVQPQPVPSPKTEQPEKPKVTPEPTEKPQAPKTAEEPQPQPEPKPQMETKASAKEPAPKEAVAEPEPKAQEEIDPNSTAVTVYGLEIKEGQVRERMEPMLERMRTRNPNLPAPLMDNYTQELRASVLDRMIESALIEKQIKDSGITVTPEEIQQHIQEMVGGQNMTIDDLKALLESRGIKFDEWKEQMNFPLRVGFKKLVEPKWNQINVDEESIKQYYTDNKRLFENPEQVRASHILITPDPNADPNEAKAAAKAKAEDLLKQVKAGADFAELAKANSSCSSAPMGGDVGFFARRTPGGKGMVKPFEDAAFNLQSGQISDVVETQFGFHIIKVTDRKEASITPLEEARDTIIKDLTDQKKTQVITEYIDSLKKDADIVYPPGKEPSVKAQKPVRRRPPRRKRDTSQTTESKQAEPQQTEQK